MTEFVPYLTEEYIEQDAESLLTAFAHTRGGIIKPPIPIDDIVEKHLKLCIEIDDTHRLFGIPRSGLGFNQGTDILGAIFFDEKRIVIDESLDPDQNPLPGIEGRYRFTLAHEGGGHWQLHRRLFANVPEQMFPSSGQSVPSFLCLTSQAEMRVERQADIYASCLLMPRSLVKYIWRERFRSLDPLIYETHRWTVRIDGPNRNGLRRIGANFGKNTDYDHFADEWASYFAQIFLVSRQAMRIRLETLGLLLRDVPQQKHFASLA